MMDPPAVAPLAHGPMQTPAARINQQAVRTVKKLGLDEGAGAGGGLLSEPILVVNQKAKLFERKAEYSIFDRTGRRIGLVVERGHSLSKVALGANGTRRLQIFDEVGQLAMTLLRPATVLKSTVTVLGADGAQIGRIVQENLGVLGPLSGRFNVRFRLESGGDELGTIYAENWKAWDFSIQDPLGAEVARLTKTWAGFAKERFTKADNYVVEIHSPMAGPLRFLVVAAALALDTVLKQEVESPRRHRGRRRFL